MDPLRCLRDFCTNSRLDQVRFSEANSKISFGEEYEFPSDTQTRFQSQKGDAYSLGALLFYMQHKNASAGEYIKEATRLGIGKVARADQQNVQAFLLGTKNEAAIPEISRPTAAPLKRPRDARPAVSASLDAQPYSLAQHERKLRCRDNLLIVAGKDFSRALAIYKTAENAVLAQAKAEKQSRADEAAARLAKPQTRVDRAHVGPSAQHAAVGVNIFGSHAAAAAPGRPGGGAAGRGGAAKGGPAKGGGKAAAAKQQLLRPIIVVPDGMMALVNLYNAPKLLGEGHFLTTTDARAALDGAAKPTQPVVISRPSALDPRRQVRYEVVDKAPSTGSERWERVVAVVCLGKKWQFRGYPFKGAEEGNTVEMFSSLCGFFFHFRDEDVPDSIKSWNVRRLTLDRNARHNDVQTAQVFFETIVKFLDNRAKDANIRKGCKPSKLQYK